MEQQLTYSRQTYVDRISTAEQIMSYRGIKHALATN
jgi:hypothetical protein